MGSDMALVSCDLIGENRPVSFLDDIISKSGPCN